MHDVFISYAREDAARVKGLVDALVAVRGWSVWRDTALRPGEQFPVVIEHAVEEARCVLVIWSPRSVDSQWVVAEVSEGWQRHVLVPVIIEDCEPPLPFRQTQAADLTRWRGKAGAPEFLALREQEAGHPIEKTGRELRAQFSWKQQDADYVEGSAAR